MTAPKLPAIDNQVAGELVKIRLTRSEFAVIAWALHQTKQTALAKKIAERLSVSLKKSVNKHNRKNSRAEVKEEEE